MTKQELQKQFDDEIAYWNEALDEAYRKYKKGGMKFEDFNTRYFDAMARIETLEYAKRMVESL